MAPPELPGGLGLVHPPPARTLGIPKALRGAAQAPKEQSTNEALLLKKFQDRGLSSVKQVLLYYTFTTILLFKLNQSTNNGFPL